jgi:IS30 family transposase
MQISHETIYRSLFVQTRGVLKKELMVHLRTARQIRPSQGRHPEERTISIRERPTEAEDRAVPGHWGKLPQQLRRSLTWDRGKEMADHKNFTIATNVKVYFCDPRSPWQRGSNENINSISRKEQTSRVSLRSTSTGSRCDSINALGRPWDSRAELSKFPQGTSHPSHDLTHQGRGQCRGAPACFGTDQLAPNPRRR